MPPEAPAAPEPALPAAAPAVPAPAAEAPPEGPFKLGASIWSRYELRDNYQEHGLTHPRLHREGDYVVSRARLTVKTTPVDVGDGVSVSATVAPQAAYTWGENAGAAPTVSDSPPIQLYEGYASVGSDHYRVDAGRFSMNYGDALVIGDLGWNEAARAFNGARLHLTPSETPFYIDAFGSIIVEGRSVTQKPVAGDTYFYGVYAGLGPLVAKDYDLDVYALFLTPEKNSKVVVADPMDPTSTALGRQKSATEATLGARVKGKAAIVDYRAEAGFQFGKKPIAPTFLVPRPDTKSKTAYQLDGEIGVLPAAGFRVGLEGLVASGDDVNTLDEDEGYDELYPTSHKWLGLMDVMGPRTNVLSGVLHVKYAIEPVTFLLDGHYFARPKRGADHKHGAVGEEIDFNVAYAIGKGFSLRGLYGVFLPNEDFWTPKSPDKGAAGDPLHFFELQFGYELK